MTDEMTAENMEKNDLIKEDEIRKKIHTIRGFQVMLDADIASFFGVTTGNLNKAMKRNIERFPDEFCFQLTEEELSRFQTGIPMQRNGIRGGRTYLPYAYTEQGVAMLTSCLHTPKAIAASVRIINTFVEMSHYLRQSRQLMPSHQLYLISQRQDAIEADFRQLKEMVEEDLLRKDDLSILIRAFSDTAAMQEILLLDGEPFRADMAFQGIYAAAEESIIIVDDYISIKTLSHLAAARENINITIISDNKGSHCLRPGEYRDFLAQYRDKAICFHRNDGKFHDRYIPLDYGTAKTRLYHCGMSSKDAGRRVGSISRMRDFDECARLIVSALNHPMLELR